jgi:predicted DNA-binding transcriptional regulator AlpA
MTLERILVTWPELRELGIRFSRQHTTRLVSKGLFPKPVRLGGADMSTKAHWRLADILDWIEERARASGLPPRLVAPLPCRQIDITGKKNAAGREPAAS